MPRDKYAALYTGRLESFGGFDYNFMPVATFDHDDDRRKSIYESLMEKGDFSYWLATYYDMLFSDEANTEAYNFWSVVALLSAKSVTDHV